MALSGRDQVDQRFTIWIICFHPRRLGGGRQDDLIALIQPDAVSIRPKGQRSLVLARGARGFGFRVASRKSGPVAEDVPRFARQHTNIAMNKFSIIRLSGWTLPGHLTGPWKPAVRHLPARSSPEYTEIVAFRSQPVSACGGPAGNCPV